MNKLYKSEGFLQALINKIEVKLNLRFGFWIYMNVMNKYGFQIRVSDVFDL